MTTDPLMPADETDPDALRRALLAHATARRRERTRRPSSAPWNSLAALLLLGMGVAAVLIFSGDGPREIPGLSRPGTAAEQRPATVRGL